MPRHQTHRVRQYFLYDQIINRSNCLVDRCNESVKGNHAGNLMRHLRKHHRKIFEEIIALEAKKIYEENPPPHPPRDPSEFYAEKKRTPVTPHYQPPMIPSADYMKKGCVEMVVMNCRPLSIFKDSGFLKIIEPILMVTNAGFMINDQTVQLFIEYEAEEIKNKIREELKGKIVSIKIDTLTRSKRTALTLNVQFIDNGRVNVRSLTSFELDENVSSEILFGKIIHTLSTYGIELQQIHLILYDTGANIVNLENEEFHMTEADIEIDSEDHKKIVDLLEETISMLRQSFQDQVSFLNLYHTTLLTTFFYSAVILALKQYDIQHIINFVQKIRVPTVLDYLNEHNLQFPPTDFNFTDDTISYDTKIIAIQNLLTILLMLKNFLNNESDKKSETNYFYLQPVYYKKAYEMKNGLDIILQTVKTFQTQDLTISDFYGEWLRCKLNISKFGTEFGVKLNEQFNKYEKEFLVITHISAAIYLDPRYQVTLPIDRRQEAKWHIKNVWDMFNKIIGYDKKPNEDEFEKHLLDISIVKVENPPNTEYDEFDDYIKNISVDNIENSSNDTNIENLIEEFENFPRIPYKSSVLSFWEEHKQTKTELYKLSKIIYGTPASQSSIARCFSTLGYLLSIEESMDENTLENIFIIRLYNQFCN